MSLAAGARLGPYEILAPLGAGGMGEVYRARDTRLAREVAVKVLPEQAAADPERRERFEREARIISSLNHPHICTLHDVGRDGDTSYLVMELLEGETLAKRLERGPLKAQAALQTAAEIASALDRAHGAGIVHRDLKPGNVVITRTGAKVLDFGIAKLVEETPDGAATGHLPTRTTPLTAQGSIVGTLNYMSPEQLEGRPVDHRADIFSLGAVLYEMLTGKRAFDGASQASVIAAILERDPQPPSSIDPTMSPAIDRVVRDCLAKNPQDRRQSAHDLASEVRGLAELPTTALRAVTRKRPTWRVTPWIILAAGVVAIAVLWALDAKKGAPPKPPKVELELHTRPTAGGPPVLSISPDLASVVFVDATAPGGVGELWVRRLDRAEPRRVEGAKRPFAPFWSPDGREIAYFDEGMLRAISASGGNPREIVRTDYGVGGAWTRAGTIVYCPSFMSGLKRIDASGGAPKDVTTLDASRKESGHVWPVALPGGKSVLFLCRTIARESSRIEMVPIEGGSRKVVTDADALVGFSSPWLLFVRGGTIFAQRFDPTSGTLGGDRIRVAENADFSEGWATAGAVVQGDVLAWHAYRSIRVRATWWSPDGRPLGTAFEDDDVRMLRIAPDGRRVAIQKHDPGRGSTDIWVLDLERSIRTRLTDTRGADSLGGWIAGGAEVVYSTDEEGTYAVRRCAADGSGANSLVVADPTADLIGQSVSPDGTELVVERSGGNSPSALLRVPLADPAKASELMPVDSFEHGPHISPDGKWLVFQSSRSGRSEVYVRRLEGGAAVQISVGGGAFPRWDPRGDAVYFVSAPRTTTRVPLELRGDRAEPGRSVDLPLLHHGRGRSWDIAPDGRILILGTEEDEPGGLRVTVGWRGELDAR